MKYEDEALVKWFSSAKPQLLGEKSAPLRLPYNQMDFSAQRSPSYGMAPPYFVELCYVSTITALANFRILFFRTYHHSIVHILNIKQRYCRSFVLFAHTCCKNNLQHTLILAETPYNRFYRSHSRAGCSKTHHDAVSKNWNLIFGDLCNVAQCYKMMSYSATYNIITRYVSSKWQSHKHRDIRVVH
jgi:hypothetical protein